MLCLDAYSTNRNEHVLEIRQLVALAAASVRLTCKKSFVISKIIIIRQATCI